MQQELELVPLLLRSMAPFLCVAMRVRSSQQKAAYAEMSKRCLSYLRTYADLAVLAFCLVTSS